VCIYIYIYCVLHNVLKYSEKTQTRTICA